MSSKVQPPAVLFDDGWFEWPWKAPAPDGHCGYRIWDVEQRWKAVPASLRPYSWLQLYVPWENITNRRNAGDVYVELNPPEPDPFYPRKLAAFQSGLAYAEANRIPVILQVRRASKRSESRPSYEVVERALTDFKCVKALYYNELAGSGFSDADEEHLTTFTAMAKKTGKKAMWAIYFDKRFPAWNHMMGDPKWLDFFRRNKGTLVPFWKNVEPFNDMLLWADCVGMWLAGLVEEWGFEFDDWYWINYFCHTRKTHRSKFGPAFHADDTFEMSGMSCPQYLVKDTMILSALTGASYMQTEADPSFMPYDTPYGSFGGSLRSVRLKVAEVIATEGLRRSRVDVANNVRAVVETAAQPSDILRLGYQYTYPEAGPNHLFSAAFGVPDGSFCTLPKKAPYYMVPIMPVTWRREEFPGAVPQVIRESQLAATASILARETPSPISSDDPNVLVFDAGEFVYITDNREEDRTGRYINIRDALRDEYEFTYLAEDSTPVKVKAPPMRDGSAGRDFTLCLFAGGSFLLRRLKQSEPSS